jgi:DNA polymerase
MLPGERQTGQRPPLFHFDFETYNDLSIKSVGTDVYTAHPSLEIILMASQIDPEPGQALCPMYQTESEEEALTWVLEAYQDPELLFCAFNAPFEAAVLKAKGIDIPLNRWICVMAWSYACSFRGNLRDVGEQLDIPTDAQKLKSGTRLITRFCSPQKPTKRFPDRIRLYPEDAPEAWDEFKEYNRQDVTAEIAISRKLEKHFPDSVQRAEYIWDQEVNRRGLPIDMQLVDACCEVYAQELDNLKGKMQAITGLQNPNSTSQLLEWFNACGVELPNLQKATVRYALTKVGPGPVKEVLKLRALISRSSPKKWIALKRATGAFDRLRYAFQLWGASRTFRWSGRVYQPQNLPHPITPLEHLAELLYARNRELIERIHPSVISVLVSLIRNAVTAPPGKLLVVADLSSIESVVLGYVSGCERINRTFREGRDLYKEFGSGFYGKPEEEITKAERQFSKPPVLACGYGISASGLVEYAQGMGVKLDMPTAEFMIHIYHNRYREVSKMWGWLESAIAEIIQSKNGETRNGYCVQIWKDEEFLYIQKPSGWCLKYHKPKLEKNRWNKVMFSYMGWDQYKNKWRRLHARGAMVTENIIQSISRDVLMHGLWLAYGEGLDVCGHVHDEGIGEAEESEATQALTTLIRCLTTVPACMPGLLLGAEGHIMKRYAKK